MLEIYASGKRLHLPEDISVDMTFENPMFLQERIPSAYSMDFDLPFTPENLNKTGHPNRVAAKGAWEGIDSKILFDMATILNGKLMLQEAEKSLRFSFVGNRFPDIVKKPLSGMGIERYDFGAGDRLNPDFDSGWGLTYKDTIFNNLVDIGNKFAACPVRVKNEKWYWDSDAWGYLNAWLLYLNMWNVDSGSFVFSNKHAAIFPQPYIYNLVKTILGDALNTNFFAGDSELKKLCLITTYHDMFTYMNMINYYGVICDNDEFAETNYFYLSSFFNTYPFNDFLKNILKIFCCSLMPRPDGKWDILHNKEILDNVEIIDWSSKLAGTPVIGMQRSESYQYGYGSDDVASPEIGWCNSIDDLLSNSTTSGKYLIKSTGEAYEKKLRDAEIANVYDYERLSTGFGSSDSSEDDDGESFDMTSEVCPTPMMPDSYWWLDAEPVRLPWYVPEFDGDRYKKNFSPTIGFMRGFYNLATKQIDANPADYSGHYPFLSPYNYDMAGNKVGNYSLAWTGDDGLINKFHSDFKAYVARDRQTLKASFRLTHLDLKNLDYTKKVYVRGKLYYIKKIETTLRLRSIALCKCELIEA